jgi:hypothetical protein
MSDRIDGPVDPVKSTGSAALAHSAVAESEILELSGGDDAVLSPRERGDLGVNRVNVTKRNQWFRNVAFTGRGTSVAAASASLNAEMSRWAPASRRER